jgi:hypothetical protein
MNPRTWADSSLARSPPIILNWPRSVERGGSAPPLDFDGTGDAGNPAQPLLTAVESFFCPRLVRWLGRQISNRIVGIFGARNGISQGWVADWAID